MADRGARFESPADLNRFVSEVRRELEDSGLIAAASTLAAVQETAFTTGSEWLGELGRAVNEIRKQRDVPSEVRTKLEAIRSEVRRIWPRP